MINNLKELLISQVRDLYDAENRNAALFSRLQAIATDDDLKNILVDHHLETETQIARLKEACADLAVAPEGETCEATKGLVKEAEELIGETDDSAVKDAAIILSVQRIKHYEIASYGSAATFAETLKEFAVADLLKNNLAEEKATDEKLKKIATGGLLSTGLNEQAAE